MAVSNPTAEVMQFLLLDEQNSPGYFSKEGLALVRNDPELRELMHGALVFIASVYKGNSVESIQMADSFLAGVVFSALAQRQTIAADTEDRELFAPEQF